MYKLYPNNSSQGNTQEEADVMLLDAVQTADSNTHELVVYNDDHNTFDWVIECFVEVLGHTEVQAEQLSLIIHFKGKATVMTASFDTLKPKKDALIDRGLSAVIVELAQ